MSFETLCLRVLAFITYYLCDYPKRLTVRLRNLSRAAPFNIPFYATTITKRGNIKYNLWHQVSKSPIWYATTKKKDLHPSQQTTNLQTNSPFSSIFFRSFSQFDCFLSFFIEIIWRVWLFLLILHRKILRSCFHNRIYSLKWTHI